MFDLLVIGAGPGGYTAAARAAKLGLSTAIVEERSWGGTCLNRGCVPTKTLLHASEVYRSAADGAAIGIHAEGLQADIPEIFAYKERISRQLCGGVESLLKGAGVTLLRGRAVITAPGSVRVTGEDGGDYEARRILIATGSVPVRPPIPGLELAMTSDELLEGTDHLYRSIVIIGGDDSNTNAAVLAEYFAAHNSGIQVIGCPKTIDGDLKNEDIECSFGFDTATKTYSEIIGNIERDANSAKKYWHFVKVMGRSASHVALECALETQPNICLIGEEVAEKKMSLAQIADYIADSVATRAAKGWNFGVAIIPEGIVEFVPEFSVLIAEINELLAGEKTAQFNALPTWEEKYAFIKNGLTKQSMDVFAILPQSIQQQLFLERDPHGNVQVSLIESEKLFSALVRDNLAARKAAGTYNGKFSTQHHFLGYEGRCAFPSNFDADYCYSLGYNAFMLIQYGYTGYLSKVSNLSKPAEEWVAGGMPITKMMNMERRNGKDKPVIRKALVELDGKPFRFFAEHRAEWAVETCYTYPGAIQYFGPREVCDLTTRTLALEKA